MADANNAAVSGAKEAAAEDTNSDSKKQEVKNASKMTIKKAISTADNARLSPGGEVEGTTTKADKGKSSSARGGAAAAGAEDAPVAEPAKVGGPHMGGGVRCARVRLMEYRGLVVYARVLSRFPCAPLRCSTDRNTAHQQHPTPYRRRRRRRSNH